mgnify:FL=1
MEKKNSRLKVMYLNMEELERKSSRCLKKSANGKRDRNDEGRNKEY